MSARCDLGVVQPAVARPPRGTPRAGSRGPRRRPGRPRPVRRSQVRSKPLPARRRRGGGAAAAAGIRRARRSSPPGSTRWRTGRARRTTRYLARSRSVLPGSRRARPDRCRGSAGRPRAHGRRGARGGCRPRRVRGGRGREIAIASLIVRGHREQAGGLSPLRSGASGAGAGVHADVADDDPASAPAGGEQGTRRHPGHPHAARSVRRRVPAPGR